MTRASSGGPDRPASSGTWRLSRSGLLSLPLGEADPLQERIGLLGARIALDQFAEPWPVPRLDQMGQLMDQDAVLDPRRHALQA